MNQLCKVCGEPAAGYHFGAFTCEGCKSFFGRTYSNLSALGECKNNGQCVINKKNRTSCKSCRLKKCLVVGMSKSGSRYGRRSNWFKIHCLIQDQAEKANSKLDDSGSTCTSGTSLNPESSPGSIPSPSYNTKEIKSNFHSKSNFHHPKSINNNNNNNFLSKSVSSSLSPSSGSKVVPPVVPSGHHMANLQPFAFLFNTMPFMMHHQYQQQLQQAVRQQVTAAAAAAAMDTEKLSILKHHHHLMDRLPLSPSPSLIHPHESKHHPQTPDDDEDHRPPSSPLLDPLSLTEDSPLDLSTKSTSISTKTK